MKKTLLYLALCAIFTSCTTENLPQAHEVLALIKKVNAHWQEEHPLVGSPAEDPASPDLLSYHPYSNNSPFWHNAAYHTGNMEVYKLTADEEALAYTKKWAEANNYVGATGNDPAKWRYDYGEKPEFVLFGDWQICFQTYCDLYELEPAEEKIARAREVMEYEMATPNFDYWWWADGLYMVMPTMTKLYRITGNDLYLSKLFEYWAYAKDLMYDDQEIASIISQTPNDPQHLFYRDGKYLYPRHKTESGRKDFWARGNGWVVAGLAKVLQDMPKKCQYHDEFLTTFREMCAAVKSCQQPEGYWTRSLLDPEQAPGPETSGTAFFCYGLLWGINNRVLDRNEYLPTALKAWEYLTTTALQEDGRLGYVQPIGERAIPGQVVDANSTANFGVGAFLLAACEMYRLVK